MIWGSGWRASWAGLIDISPPPGSGISAPPALLIRHPEAQADLYAALLDLLKIDSVVVIGLSGGGASALQFALRHPERCRGLILISAISRQVPPLPRFLAGDRPADAILGFSPLVAP